MEDWVWSTKVFQVEVSVQKLSLGVHTFKTNMVLLIWYHIIGYNSVVDYLMGKAVIFALQ